jgi:hypothetical protein
LWKCFQARGVKTISVLGASSSAFQGRAFVYTPPGIQGQGFGQGRRALEVDLDGRVVLALDDDFAGAQGLGGHPLEAP